MKKALLLLTLFISVSAFAQNKKEATVDDKYTATMKKNLATLDTAKTQATYIKLTNKFERIANAEKSKWLAYYWAAFCNISQVYMSQDRSKIDAYLDKADKFIAIADSLNPENDEIHVLQGWSYGARIMVDPMTRGMKYAPKSNKEYKKAEKINPNNPRIYYLQGTATLFTPTMFGGGATKALPLLKKSKENFGTFKPETEIHPDWGEEQCDQMIAMAEKKIVEEKK